MRFLGKRFLQKRLRPRLLVVYAATAALIWSARPSPLSIAVGLVPIAAGIALRIWATGYLHKNDALTIAGPYAFLRHPLYLGTLLVATGFTVMAASLPAAIVFAGFLVGYFAYYLPYKERIECARLEALYGDAFRRYSVAVPALAPRVHPYRPLGGEATATPPWSVARFADNHELGTAAAVVAGVLLVAGRWALA
jgi:protein-S-isoprenylcysteine O-methyltransferase Ste14